MLWFEQQCMKKGGKEEGDQLITQLIGKFNSSDKHVATNYQVVIQHICMARLHLWIFVMILYNDLADGKQEQWIVMPPYSQYASLHFMP